MRLRAAFVVPLAAAVLVLSACGGGGGESQSGSGSHSGSVSINEVATKTRATNSAKVSLETKVGETLVQSVVGQADLSKRRFHFDFKAVDRPVIELIVIGYNGYQRSEVAKGAAAEWCAMGRVDGLNVDFGAIVEALGTDQGKLAKVGTESVRGVETTRYRIESADPTWNGTQLWVDSVGRLRRLVQQSAVDAGTRTDTAEFYDFGAPMSPITAPQATKACPAAAAAEAG